MPPTVKPVDTIPQQRKGKVKKQMRMEATRKEKERIARLREAASQRDLLEGYSAFKHFDRQGVEVTLESMHGSDVTAADVDACIALQRQNLSQLGNTETWDEEAARSALKHAESRVLILRGWVNEPSEPPEGSSPPTFDDEWLFVPRASELLAPPTEMPFVADVPPTAVPAALRPPASILGYLHLQFCIGEVSNPKAQPLLCVLNMQLAPTVMGKGLGKFALQLVELVTRRNGLDLVRGLSGARSCSRRSPAPLARTARPPCHALAMPIQLPWPIQPPSAPCSTPCSTHLSPPLLLPSPAQVMLYVKDGKVTTMSLTRSKPTSGEAPPAFAWNELDAAFPQPDAPPTAAVSLTVADPANGGAWSEALDEDEFEVIGAPEAVVPSIGLAAHSVSVGC